jgi:pimeloyl-ACP methyl ester carboxylesterase
MRGYGRSYVPTKAEECQKQCNVEDMIGLLDSIRPGSKAVFVGHDWGGPIVWQIATHFSQRCAGVVGICVPYRGPTVDADAKGNKVKTFPYSLSDLPDAGQWDYQLHHIEEPDRVAAELDADIRRSCLAIFQANYEHPGARKWNQYISMFDQRKRFKESGGGYAWFVPSTDGSFPEVTRDDRMVTEADIDRYVEGIERNGGFGPPNFYYLNHLADQEYSRTGVGDGRIASVPALMVTAEFDTVCTPAMAVGMETWFDQLTIKNIKCGHWVAQEKPEELNAVLVGWLATQLADVWPQPKTRL